VKSGTATAESLASEGGAEVILGGAGNGTFAWTELRHLAADRVGDVQRHAGMVAPLDRIDLSVIEAGSGADLRDEPGPGLRPDPVALAAPGHGATSAAP
jgi:hypothetical protein